MRRKKVIFVLASMFLLSVLAIPGYCSEKPTCAVLLFHPDTASSNIAESQNLSGNFAELLNRLDMFEVFDYNEVAQILERKNAADLEQSCTDLGCALKIGNKLNADFVIYGIIGNVGSLFSLDTTLVNVAGGNETQHAVYDFEGTQEAFVENAPAENIKSLFGLYELPPAPEPTVSDAAAPSASTETQNAMKNATAEPADESLSETDEADAPMAEQPKKLRVGPRIGIAASNDGVEFGGGFEVQFSKLSFQLLLNGDGFASGCSFYLHQDGNSPFVSLVGSYYDTKNHGVDEIGRIYGLLLGYRLGFDTFLEKDFAENMNLRVGLGAGYVNWDQTELNRDGKKDSDEEIIPVFEFTLGYMF